MTLTRERLMEPIHYDPATGIFTNKVRRGGLRVEQVLGTITSHGYITFSVDNEQHYAHRLAWLYIHDVYPRDQIDHINLIKSDNRLVNLRECSSSENKYNRHLLRNNTSGVNGVSYNTRNGRWLAQLTVTVDSTKTIMSRSCKMFEEACQARRQFELELASPFLRTLL